MGSLKYHYSFDSDPHKLFCKKKKMIEKYPSDPEGNAKRINDTAIPKGRNTHRFRKEPDACFFETSFIRK